MSPTYRIDPGARIVYIDWGDTLATPVAFRTLVDTILADPAFSPGMHFLSDRRRIPEAPDSAFTRYVVDYFRRHAAQIGRCRWATVVSADGVYGMTRMTEIINEANGVDFRGFRDIAEAEAWVQGRR